MKVGTDGILLGAWACTGSPARILDIGTGTGIVSLMLAQRFAQASIDAIEIDLSAYQQATENFTNSPWSARMRAVCADVSEWSRQPHQRGRYSLIVSNPPWFVDSLKPATAARSTARHTESLSSPELLSAVARLLSPGGCFCVILPGEQCEPFIHLANHADLHCRRCCAVLPNAGKPFKRVLLQFSPGDSSVACEHSQLIVETEIRHQYSAEFMRLTQDFYLRF